jgi:dTDP-4-amino-4,6-dideoxygalactose transaminase
MINLFNIENYNINTSKLDSLVHGSVVTEFENNFKKYVGAKYACSLNSATSIIFLSLLNKNVEVTIPSIMFSGVANAILASGNKIKFNDNTNWVGNSYILHEFNDYKIIDSAQKVERNQFKKECNLKDLMIFSFYPTKPVGGCDGGMVVSNDIEKIKWFKEISCNGMSYIKNSWDSEINSIGYKMYMNSIQAYIANENLKKLNIKKRKLKLIRDIYNEELGYSNNSEYLYRIEVINNREFIEKMKYNKILCGIHYSALHLNSIYSNNNTLDYSKSKIVSKKTVSIPFNEKLTESEINFIIDKVRQYG